MYSFKNDYSEGAHPRILEALMNANLTQNDGYGLDAHSKAAAASIKKLLNRDIYVLIYKRLWNENDISFCRGSIQGWTGICHSVGEDIILPHLDTTVWWHIVALCVTDLSWQIRGDKIVLPNLR